METKFKLPKYAIPIELKLALKKGLDNKESVDSKSTSPRVCILKQLIEERKVPVNNLADCFMLLLSVEQHFENEEIKKHKLYNQSIFYDKDEKYFKIIVPNLKKDDPFISAGDCVHLHAIVSKTKHVLNIVEISNGYLYAEPRHFEESVQWYLNQMYDISFDLSHYPARSTQYAIETIKLWKFKNDILNPSKSNLNDNRNHINVWFNPNIMENKEQKKAIHDIINKTAFPVPYILFGPPGTGKTATIVEAISQIYLLDSTNKVLVCTPANNPADDMTKMLLKNLPSNTILRLLSFSRKSKIKDEEIINCSNFNSGSDNKKKRRLIDEIQGKSVIICTLTTALKLNALELKPSYFSHIFIDEAAQATEPETWIPISLLVDNSRTSTQVVLSGDPKQLGPVIKSKLIEHLLGVSMMERLIELNFYKNDNKKHPCITMLVKNFRCHSSILKVPNDLFYKGELLCYGGENTFQGVNWKYLPNKIFPIIFHDVHGIEKKSSEHPSSYNRNEIAACLKYVERLLEADKFKQENIGIITPFKMQEILIKNELQKYKITKIEVGTVQTFQGLEKDVIIMTTVRSRLLQHNGKTHIGFLSDKKRFNVSITRAKSLLIIIGNAHILQHDVTWLKFIDYCVDNNAYTTEKIVLKKPLKIASKVKAKPVNKQSVKSSSRDIVKFIPKNTDQTAEISPVSPLQITSLQNHLKRSDDYSTMYSDASHILTIMIQYIIIIDHHTHINQITEMNLLVQIY